MKMESSTTGDFHVWGPAEEGDRDRRVGSSTVNMTESLLLTNLSMENPSTLLSMDSGLAQEDNDFCRPIPGPRPPDINLPFTVDINPASWFNDASDILNVGLACQGHDVENVSVQKGGRRCSRRADVIWGAWFFFNNYFRPLILDKSKAKSSREVLSPSKPLDKDLILDRFLVQHDMENMYMWVFKERPQNALGKMQLRSYMNGHTKQGEPQFPFSADRGFSRSHKMQRKQYKGLSNPQCIHGIELVRYPNLSNVSDDDKNRWAELTGRDLNFSIPLDAEGFVTWRTLAGGDSDFERSGDKDVSNHTKKLLPKRSLGKLNGAMLNLSRKSPSFEGTNAHNLEKNKRKELSPASSEECSLRALDMESPGPPAEQPHWLANFNGVMTDACGPVTAAKTIYEDEKGYLIMVSLPFIDIQRVRVSWFNTARHGIVKLHCKSTARAQYIRKGDRTFELTDPSPEHCPPGEFIREIVLATRIPENAELQAFYVEAGAGLEIMVPKHHDTFEEREVRIFLPPQLGHCDSLHT